MASTTCTGPIAAVAYDIAAVANERRSSALSTLCAARRTVPYTRCLVWMMGFLWDISTVGSQPQHIASTVYTVKVSYGRRLGDMLHAMGNEIVSL